MRGIVALYIYFICFDIIFKEIALAGNAKGSLPAPLSYFEINKTFAHQSIAT